ncbi:MAG: formate-dependent phosphoribosylglycinamide formyltransferase [Mycobacteriaceae bacterium]|nr:formate-dependent phosphoribosylglycinamide formyltransferase [Mycobacteriaceae bacterium]
MILGAGELSRELVTAFGRLGAVVIAVDRYAEAPAHGVADRSVVVKMTDPDELTAVIEREQPDYVVTEGWDPGGGPVIDNDALVAVGERGVTDVVPTARSSRLSLDREGLRRLAADELGLPTAPFWFAGSVDELGAIAAHAGFPLVVRPVTGAAGDGESVLLRQEDVAPAWDRAAAAGGRVANTRVIAETMVEIDHEVTLLTVRSAGRVQFCEPIGHRQVDGDVLESWQPQEMTDAANDAARSIAARIVNALGGRGVYGVELLVKGNEVYFVDVSPRPDDSGLVTLRSQRLSEFELHARAILGLPVDTIMITPGAAQVVYAGQETANADLAHDDSRTERATQALSDALAVPESDVRIFWHPKSYPRRRLGVALATAADVKAARDRVHQVTTALRKFW